MRPHLLALALVCFPVLLHAQGAQRTWVSGVGDDANPCSRTTPCKTFAGAISKTAAGGVISVLDPGGFGAVTITKAITIERDANASAVLVSAGNGINVNAGATDVVTLRNITFEGLGTSASGVNIIQAGAVHVEGCAINGFATAGITFATTNAGAQLFVKDTLIHKCTGPGIALSATAASTAHIVDCHISACGTGVNAGTNAVVQINNTVCDTCTGAGFLASASSTRMVLATCTSTLNGLGVQAQAGGAVGVTECSIFSNTGAGLAFPNGSNILSFGNNTIHGNNPDGSPLSTTSTR